MAAIDRAGALKAQDVVTGIDFVYVHPDQTTLDVYFLRPAETLQDPLATDPGAGWVVDLSVDQVHVFSPAPAGTDAGDLEAEIPDLDWYVDPEGVGALRVTVAEPGGFDPYYLAIDDPRLDPYFQAVRFSFKANCPKGVDCDHPEGECPAEAVRVPAIDYRARDFWSFRRALLDFASLHYPDWSERHEADAAVMLTEALSALADEFAYHQDRVAREAHLETATQRRSLRRHARLVDYTIHDGRGAAAWLDVAVAAGQSGALDAGTQVQGTPLHGRPVVFATGTGLADEVAGYSFAVNAAINALTPHIWDEDDTCLPVGATEVWVKGHVAADLVFDDPPAPADPTGKWVLLRTNPEDRSVQPRRILVRVTEVEELEDPLINDPDFGHAITRLGWEVEQALEYEVDLETLSVRGNLVPATAGEARTREFVIGEQPDPDAPQPAVERLGPNGVTTFFSTLPDEDGELLVWLGEDLRNTGPEVHLVEVDATGAEGDEWTFRRSFVGVFSSQSTDRHFTLDDGAYRRIVRRYRDGAPVDHVDYASGAGFSIRFGDGEFGLIPAEGTRFRARYRLGNGKAGNLPADTITSFVGTPPLFVEAVSNPLAATGGEEAETAAEVRQLAPEAYRAVTYRAVRPEDYAEAAERLPWVQRAGTRFRWTGSWLSAMATADPLDSWALSEGQRGEMRDQLDRFRQTGREVIVRDPRYADLDIEIGICATTDAYPGEVREAVLAMLLGDADTAGFFSPDNFTFATPLYRSRLEVVIQATQGVLAVDAVAFRRRGWFSWRAMPLVYRVGDHEVIRVENDLDHADRGTLRLEVRGGA